MAGNDTIQKMVNMWKSRGLFTELNMRFLRATVFFLFCFFNCLMWMGVMSNDQQRQEKNWILSVVLQTAVKSVLEWQEDQWMSAWKNWVQSYVTKQRWKQKVAILLACIQKTEEYLEGYLAEMIKSHWGRGHPPTAWTDIIEKHACFSMVATIGVIWLREIYMLIKKEANFI